jgi:dihydropteroate synthase
MSIRGAHFQTQHGGRWGIVCDMAFTRRPHFVWQLRTRTLALGERTLLMQIVNLTPDSFSGDGLGCSSDSISSAIDVALTALDNGADILDFGAESTRPNATPLGAEEEQQRLLAVLTGVLRLRPEALISVDTYHSQTARAAIEAGAEIINDVSGLLWDPAMAATAAELGCGLVLMHTRGRPQQWGGLPPLAAADVMPLVIAELTTRLEAAREAGIAAERIVLDPGFGFGKLGAANLTLLARFAELHGLGRPLLAGVSRKKFLGDVVANIVAAKQPAGLPLAQARLQATTAANVAAALAGAHILRVHDLQAMREAAAIADAVLCAAG